MIKQLRMKSLLLLCALIVGSVSSAWADDVVTWVKTAPESLNSGDIVVVVEQANSKAMSHESLNSNKAPNGVAVTLNAEKSEITSEVAAGLQWSLTITGSGASRTYKLSKDASNHLYVTADNNGVRIGSGERNTFSITSGGDNGGYYLNNTAQEKGTSVTRYIGLYSNTDWRCYSSINNNIKGNNNAFYKKVVTSSSSSEATAPTFSLPSGSYIYGKTFSLSSTNFKKIIYTVDGSDPTPSHGTEYDNEISITGTINIKAIATDESDVPTAIVSRSYVVKIPDAPTFSRPTGNVEEGTTVTISAEALCVISYTTDGSDPSTSGTATLTDSNTKDVTINETTTIRAIAVDGEATESTEATTKYIVLDSDIMTETKSSFTFDNAEEVNGNVVSDIAWTVYKGGAGTDPGNYNSAIRLYQISGTNKYGGYLKLTAPTGFTIKQVTITSTNTYATTVTYTEGGSTDVTANPSSSLAKSSDYTIVTDNQTVSIFNLGTGSSGRLEIGEIKVYYLGSGNVTLSSACTDGSKYYGTYSNSHAFVVPDGLTVSEIKVANSKLTVENYATGDVVPANTGVMVSATTSGEKTIKFSGRTGSSVLDSDNMLKASGDAGKSAVEMNEANKLFYRLTMHNYTDLGFYWGAADGAAFSIAANKAYLAVPKTAGARIAGFNLFENEGEATAIKGVKTVGMDAPVFNLNGQRVNSNAKGLLIKNGKKFMNR